MSRSFLSLMAGLFQHTAARRRLDTTSAMPSRIDWFQHTAARRRLGPVRLGFAIVVMFQHTAARRRLGVPSALRRRIIQFQHTAARRRLALLTFCLNHRLSCFNTQPPEGGWTKHFVSCGKSFVFQHTAARRRLVRPDVFL